MMLEKGTLELVDQPSPGFLWQALVGAEGNEGVTSCDHLIKSERVHNPHQVSDGDSCISLEVNQERGCDVLD